MARTYWVGKNMLGCALVYLIDGDTSYADGAVYWLNQCKDNFDPQDQAPYDPNNPAGLTLEKMYHFNPIQVTIPIVYDLMYNYMASNRPADLTNLTAYIQWVGGRMAGSFDHNENHQNHYGRALCGYALGKELWITEVEDDFKSWYNGGTGDVSDGFHYEVGTQAMKHFAIVFESQVHYALAAHNAVRKGYRTWDPVTWTNSGGFNLIQDNWRFLIKKSTPLFQVPYESMWRGNHHLTPTCSGFYNMAHVMTGNEEWQAVAAANPGRKIIPNFLVNTDWAGLAHGRQISGTPRFTNDCVRNREIGFAVLNSGDPSGYTDPATALNAYMMCGDYGETPPMNLILYGKGKMLNTAIMRELDDTYGERATGGNVVDLFTDADISVTPTEHVWAVSNATIKIMAYEEYGHHRAVAVTKDYFADVYDVTKSSATSMTWYFQGIGPTNTALSRAAGTFSGNFTCTWPDHMKTYVINDGSSTVSLTDDARMPYSIDETVGPEYLNVKNRLVNPIYTTELVRKLGVRRTVAGNTRFISVVEPLGQGSVLTSVQRFNTHNTAEVTGLKIVSANYTDYYFYANTNGTFTLTNETEMIMLDGKWGLVRVEDGSATVSGDIVAYQIPGAAGGLTQVLSPSITPDGGTFAGSVTVSLSTIPSDAEIYYTIDGSLPAESSTLYGTPFLLTNSATVKAVGMKSGLSNSAVSSAEFIITPPVAPSAGFTASPVSGTAPLNVTFTDTSTGTITNRFWNFGDGTTTNTASTNITHIYTNSGACTVELVVGGPAGVSTNRQTDCISVEAQTAVVITINGDTADQVRRSDGTFASVASSFSRIGNDTATSGIFCAWVIPFLLPDIGSGTISAASIHTFVEKTAGAGLEVPGVSLDLLGVRVNASKTVLSTDYQGTVVGDNLYSVNSSFPLGAIEFSSAGLAAWLQSIYDTDTNAAGKYVFLTITPDAVLGKYDYIDFTSASGATSANRPTLYLTLGSPAGTAGDADDDGLPDEWENQYFGGSTNANPHALAANGVNTILEAYVAGLNPTNSEKFLSSVLWKYSSVERRQRPCVQRLLDNQPARRIPAFGNESGLAAKQLDGYGAFRGRWRLLQS
jgi:PKD repeat protein